MKEVFKDVKGYEGIYQVSDFGNVKSLSRTVFREGGSMLPIRERILKSHKDKKGYLKVELCKYNKGETCSISVLMAIAFLNHTPCGFKIVVDHINNIPYDNRIDNLQLISQRKNSTKDNTNETGLTGVSYLKKINKWVATICYDNNHKHLGRFTSKGEAHQYYKNAVYSIENNLEIKVKKAIFSSKYKGVSWSKVRNLWMATVRVKNKVIYLGSSNDELECYKLVTDFLT